MIIKIETQITNIGKRIMNIGMYFIIKQKLYVSHAIPSYAFLFHSIGIRNYLSKKILDVLLNRL